MVLKAEIERKMNKHIKEIPDWNQDECSIPISSNESSSSDLSVPQLIDQLCGKLCEDLNECSATKKRKTVKRLKVLAFQLLLKKSISNLDEEYDTIHKDELIGTLMNQVLLNEMRSSTWTRKKKEEVLKVVDILSDKMNELPSLGSVISFLLCMSECSPLSKCQSSRLDVMNQKYDRHRVCGISGRSSSNASFRTYSDCIPSLFDTKMIVDGPFSNFNHFNKMTDIKDMPFDSEPGTGLQLFDKFSTLWSSNSNSCRTLTDFHCHEKTNSLNIPELNLDVPRSLTIPSLRSVHLDEGYVTPDKEFLDDKDDKDTVSKLSRPDMWHNLTTESLMEPLRYSWESLGKAVLNKELPFLLQSDVSVIDTWKKHIHLLNKDCFADELEDSIDENDSSELNREGCYDEMNTISFNQFFRDVKCLLIAINTQTFHFDEESSTFVIKPGVCVPGITPEGLEDYSKDLIECANNFRSLDLLIKKNSSSMRPTLNDSNIADCTLPTTVMTTISCNTTNETFQRSDLTVHKGLVFEAMCSSICCWLQAYRGVVIKMVEPDSCSLLDVKLWLRPLLQQLRFLVNLCCLTSPDLVLPTGGALLTHIYNIVQVTISEPFSYILYHILENCSKVYFRFLENWLFEGVCDDLFGEFFIEQKNSYETVKDRSYWRRMFSIRQDRVPVFLSDLVNDIFVCGKTLNLVKLCNPCDPFCQRLVNIYPKITPCFEEQSLDKLAGDFHQFVLSCEFICAEVPLPNLLSPGFETDDEKESRFELLSHQRAKSFDKIKRAKEERFLKEDEKKRQLFEVMKSDMLDAERRKNEERQNQIKEERKILDNLAEEAVIETTRKNEEKQRMIQYYKSLSDAAETRKCRAEWKIKRLRLNDKRIDFLAEDKQIIKEELLKTKRRFHTDSAVNIDNSLFVPRSEGYERSPTTSGSWLTCPSYSIESCATLTSPLSSKNKLDIMIDSDDKSPRIVDRINGNIKSGSFANLLSGEDNKENFELLRKSSSDTNIYENLMNINRSSMDNFCGNINNDSSNNNNNNNNSSSINDINNVNNKNDVGKDKTKLSDKPSVLSKTDKVKDVSETDTLLKSESCTTFQASSISNNNSRNIALLFNDDFNKKISVEQILSPKITGDPNLMSKTDQSDNDLSIDYDYNYEGDEKQVLRSKIFFDTRNAAMLNKHKVYEDEYGICLPIKNDKEVDDFSSSKDKVLEIKSKMNETAIKERTEELALARSNLIEARKQAARNKARVMSSEYSIFGKTEKEYHNKTINNKSFDQLNDKVAKDDPSFVSIYKDDSSIQSVTCEESETGVFKESETTSSIFNNESLDPNGRLNCDKKPLIIDIADKIMSHSPGSLKGARSTNYTTIHYCLHRSVAIPTEIQKRFINDAVLRLFILKENFLDHLQCIRNYFFLLDGEYGRTVTRHLFTDLENVDHPSGLLTYLRLNSILRSASRSLLNESPFIDRLSFFVKETPLVFVLTDPEVLNCLSMRYRVHWPLNVVLTNDAIINYDKIFAFQLKLQRAAWSLEQDMQLLKLKNMLRSSHYRQLQIFRHTMTQFVRALSNYITRIALEESWVEFKTNLNKADTLDALYSAHVDYIKMILFRCLLNKRSETIQKTIMEVLRNILTFHELLRTGEWVYDLETGDHTHSAFTRLAHHYTAFVRILRYLIKFLHQVIGRGYQTHLDVLITFLSGNDFYLKQS